MSVTIRRATRVDAARIAPLFNLYRMFYQQPSDEALARRFITDRLQQDESVILIAEREGQALAFTQLFPSFSSVRAGRSWILNDLYVDAGTRRRGVARALLDASAAFARGDGAAGISLETTQDNAAARALYRAAGWNEDATQWYSLPLSRSH